VALFNFTNPKLREQPFSTKTFNKKISNFFPCHVLLTPMVSCGHQGVVNVVLSQTNHRTASKTLNKKSNLPFFPDLAFFGADKYDDKMCLYCKN